MNPDDIFLKVAQALVEVWARVSTDDANLPAPYLLEFKAKGGDSVRVTLSMNPCSYAERRASFFEMGQAAAGIAKAPLEWAVVCHEALVAGEEALNIDGVFAGGIVLSAQAVIDRTAAGEPMTGDIMARRAAAEDTPLLVRFVGGFHAENKET